MNKSGKIGISFMQISILIVGFIAGVWMIGGVFGEGKTKNNGGGDSPASGGTSSLLSLGGIGQFLFKSEGEYGLGGSKLKNTFWKDGVGFGAQAILQTATYAATAYGIVYFVSDFAGLDKSQTSGLSAAAAAGVGTFRLASALAEKNWLGNWAKGWGKETLGFKGAGTGFGLTTGIIAAAIVLYLTYGEEEVETYTFECYSWEPPIGGKYCEECNKQDLPCSEYQCRSLGQGCELRNVGTAEEKCVWVNPKDVKPPVITTWKEVLTTNHIYTPDNTVSPPDYGVEVKYSKSTTGCIEAFTPLSFGINLDEPASCKIDYLRKDNFEKMDYYFGGSNTLKYNHTQVLSLPGPSALKANNITLTNGGEMNLYVRCQDANGNTNTANFVFRFCVNSGPDTTPPLIVTTNLINGMPIAYNQTKIDLITYVNEPSECKWSKTDQSYDDMENSMTCKNSITEVNAQMLYECKTTLDSLKNNQDNKFYIRCKDKPNQEDRNVNSESYEFMIKGTIPLVIKNVKPNETIKDATDPVKVTLEVETSAGYDEGDALCYYSETDNDGDYLLFLNTDSYKHTQDLYLGSGSYSYFVKCVDLGGNSDTATVDFSVESDDNAPMVVRAYHEETYLKIITDEEAECVYSNEDCEFLFNDGIRMTTVDETGQFTSWDPSLEYYIKCKDNYGNEPLPDECSIVVRPFDLRI